MKPPGPFASPRRRAQRGSLSAELLIALGLLALTLLPLSVSFQREQATLRALYSRALAIELVDGEMEVLRAGGSRAFPPGLHAYTVRGESARNLPPGRFQLTIEEHRICLEWRPEGKGGGGPVRREAILEPAAEPMVRRLADGAVGLAAWSSAHNR